MLHLIKLAVGARTPDDIARHQAARAPAGDTVPVPTRQFPKRAAELEAGGSLYWVTAGTTSVRQRISAVREVTRDDGTRGTVILLERALLPVRLRRVRAFQGWRYLAPGDAPPDGTTREDAGEDAAMPAQLRMALAELCLL